MEVWRSGERIMVPLSESSVIKLTEFRKQRVSPAVPRMAATVMLVRDVEDGQQKGSGINQTKVEVFMLRRAKTMAFVPDAMVFPGGSVDAADGDKGVPWMGPSPFTWGRRMGLDENTARHIVVAAAREVFEECGVLLAGFGDGSVVQEVDAVLNEAERRALEAHEVSFPDILRAHKLVLRSDLLGLRSHWLTPEYEPQRYDTYFFAALAPKGQIPARRTSEASQAGWFDPILLMERALRKETFLVPPTLYNLQHIARAACAQKFVTETLSIVQIMLEPWVDEYGEEVLTCLIP